MSDLPATKAEAEALCDRLHKTMDTYWLGDENERYRDGRDWLGSRYGGQLLALARLGASVVGATEAWMDDGDMVWDTKADATKHGSGIIYRVLVLAGEGDK
jgi:hypothetical protein